MLQAIIALILTITSVNGDYSVHAAPITDEVDCLITYYNCQSIDGTITCHEYIYEQLEIDEEPPLVAHLHYKSNTDEVIKLLQTLGKKEFVLTLQNVEVTNYFDYYPKE